MSGSRRSRGVLPPLTLGDGQRLALRVSDERERASLYVPDGEITLTARGAETLAGWLATWARPEPPPLELWSAQGIASHFGVSRRSVHYWTSTPSFPEPIHVHGMDASVWDAASVKAWARHALDREGRRKRKRPGGLRNPRGA